LRYAVENSLGLYETNFDKLKTLLSAIKWMDGVFALGGHGVGNVYVQVIDRCPYTTTISLCQSLGMQRSLDLWVKVRIYHDAQVAEVIAYQGHQHFRPLYPYPNRYMYQPHEKRRINQFLGEWLSHCIACHYRPINLPTGNAN
jgi:uncharacterized protein